MTPPSALGMEIVYEQAQRLGLHLTDAQLSQFAAYTRFLADGNTRANLTSVTDPAEVQVRHFLDSLTAVLALPHWPDGATVVDIGAGAGFPGVPLKIVFPGLRLTLAESVGKKTQFLHHLIQHLELPDVEVLTIRAEELGQTSGYRGHFDVALARGVARMSVLIEYGLPLCKTGGHLLAWKGKDGPAEARDARNALLELGGAIGGVHSVDALSPPLPPDRWLVSVEKVRPTPKDYPRRVGLPAKQPL